MKRVCISIFSVLFVVSAVGAKPLDSILTAASFPKTADDLTFRQRMDVLADDYDVFDTVFDSNGVCIQNCPYVGITIQDYEKRLDQAAQQVQQDIIDSQQEITSGDTSAVNGDVMAESDVDDQIAKYLTDKVLTESGIDVSGNELAQQRLRKIAEQIRTDLSNNETTNVDLGDVIANGRKHTVTVHKSELAGKIQHWFQNQHPNSGGNQSHTSGAKIPTSCPLHVKPVRVSSEMGWRQKYNRNHNGMDLSVPVGTPVYAAADGRVVICKDNPGGYGYYLSIQHDKNYYTVYGHLSKWLVSNGQTVRAGQKIALSGNTGRSTGPHLHFEVLKDAPLVKNLGGVPVDPRQITKCSWNPARR